MYVCICKGITEHHIRQEVQQGARSVRDLNQRLGVCSQCGRCARCAKDVIAQALPAPDERHMVTPV